MVRLQGPGASVGYLACRRGRRRRRLPSTTQARQAASRLQPSAGAERGGGADGGRWGGQRLLSRPQRRFAALRRCHGARAFAHGWVQCRGAWAPLQPVGGRVLLSRLWKRRGRGAATLTSPCMLSITHPAGQGRMLLQHQVANNGIGHRAGRMSTACSV